LLSDIFHLANYTSHTSHHRLEDPDDEPILATAREAHASYVISLNTRHFPPDNLIMGVRFITPDEFIDLLGDRLADTQLRETIGRAGSQIP
jgi:predicted nucleic acid-binding protein